MTTKTAQAAESRNSRVRTVVAEIHAAVEAGVVDEDGAGFGEGGDGEFDVDAADGFAEVVAGIEVAAAFFGLADLGGEGDVGIGDDILEDLAIGEDGFAAIVAGGGEVGFFAVADVDEAGVAGERGDFADVATADGIHERGLAALEGAEDEEVGLLAVELLHERTEARAGVVEDGERVLEETVGVAFFHGGGGVAHGGGQGIQDGEVGFTELRDLGFHEGTRNRNDKPRLPREFLSRTAGMSKGKRYLLWWRKP